MKLVKMTVNQHVQADTEAPWTGLIKLDPYLEPFEDALKRRYLRSKDWIKTIDEHEGGLERFSRVGGKTSIPCVPWMEGDAVVDQ